MELKNYTCLPRAQIEAQKKAEISAGED